ncbi:hypothetical protein Tco_0766908 [Tanacetum coccineum]
MEKIIQIKDRLLTARSRQKSYADVRRKPMEFDVGNMVMLNVSPWKGVIRFGKRGKLSPRCVGPFKIIERIGHVAYRLELHFIEEPVEIIDREVKQLKQSRIPIVKVRWNSRRGPEFTWEREDFFMRKYPHLFPRKKRGHGDNRAPGRRSHDDEEPEEDEADEDNDEEIEEEEDEEEEDIVAEDEAKIIYPYNEADPNNRPPPASDDESEFAPSVIPVFDAENRPVPPVIHFSSTYELGESSSIREILKDIGEVHPLSPVPPTIGTAMRRIRKLNKQMLELAEVDKRIVKKIDRSDLRTRMVGRDAMSLDGVVKEC